MFEPQFQPLHLDSNSNIYCNIQRPEPSIISPQVCLEIGMDPLHAFVQSNQV